MRRTIKMAGWLIAAASVAVAPHALAQKTLAATIEVFVFPTTGQTPEEQSQAEAQCYEFAVNQTGSDPFELARQTEQQQAAARQQQQQTAQATQGAGVSGAARGAAAGALIGQIADDRPGQGAAWGAAAGGISARRSARRANQSAAQQAQQQIAQAEQASEGTMQNFRNAFAVCLEAKAYMVRF
jgi:hypothetical protein